MSSTLADSFLEDFDSGDSEDENELDERIEKSKSNSNSAANTSSSNDITARKNDVHDEENEDDDEEDDEDGDMDLELGGEAENEDLTKLVVVRAAEQIGQCRNSESYKQNLAAVNRALESRKSSVDDGTLGGVQGSLEDDPEYKLLLICNRMIADIDDDISGTHKYVVDIYAKKFPQLESLVPNKLDYCRTVERIGNEMDMTVVELGHILSASAVMIVSVTGSTTSGKPLTESELNECLRGCAEVSLLEKDKVTLLRFVESCMQRVSPNLCCLIGSRIAAQLLGIAGGVIALSKIPACNLQVIGQEKRIMSGLSSLGTTRHAGILYNCDLVQSCPPFLRRKALKQVAGKVALTARVDSFRNHPDGSEGERFRRDIANLIEKWQEPPKAKTKKALPVPEEKKKSRRAGKKMKRIKERYAVTEIRAAQNKINFSLNEGEYGDSAMGFTVGRVGSKDTGKLRVAQQKVVAFTSKKQKKLLSQSVNQANTSGLSSSLAFTPVQGIELANPNARAERVNEANKKWFNSMSGFLSAVPK